jgi:UDP-galactopyranose mutase
MPIQQVDSSIINRIKVVLGNGESYFPEDKYQGLPTKGYTNLIKSMFDHENIKVVLNSHSKDILSIDGSLQINGKKFEGNVIYCGLIDELFDYKFGELEFRSLDIKFESHNVDKFQNVAVINYPADPKMTRICEYKNMTFQSVHDWTTISKEFPGNYDKNSSSFSTPFYPVTSNKNNLSLYELYLQETKKYNNLHLLGRLSQYKYYDMDDAISAAFELYKKIK